MITKELEKERLDKIMLKNRFKLFIFMFLLIFPLQVQAKNVISLTYDDYYTFSKNYEVLSIKNTKITSYKVSKGQKTKEKDKNILKKVGENTYVARGIGSATVSLRDKNTKKKITQTVVVSPAKLSLFILAGQSNMQGTSAWTSVKDSIKCKSGTVYSTFIQKRADIAPYTNLVTVCSDKTAKDVVAGNLTGTVSCSGKTMGYPLDALTTGKGKYDPDSGLAYEWNRLTNEKVWTVNVALGSSSIVQWCDNGNCITNAKYVAKYVKQTFQAEIAAGHYTKGHILGFWLQGEADKKMSYADYKGYFTKMILAMKQAYGLEKMGLIAVRACLGNQTTTRELELTGPRLYQYLLGESSNSFIYLVSNVNFSWTTNKGVASYFQKKYPKGYSYPTRRSIKLPTSVKEVHPQIHYTQIAHNENGITAAQGMYKVVFGRIKDSSVKVNCIDQDGTVLSYIKIKENESRNIVFITNPCYAGKSLSFRVDNSNLSVKNGLLKGLKKGNSKISVYYKNVLVKTLKVEIN